MFLQALIYWLDSPDLRGEISERTFTLRILLGFTKDLFEQLSQRPKVRFVQILYSVVENIAQNY